MAEGAGFEPAGPLRAHSLSRQALSTTQPSLHGQSTSGRAFLYTMIWRFPIPFFVCTITHTTNMLFKCSHFFGAYISFFYFLKKLLMPHHYIIHARFNNFTLILWDTIKMFLQYLHTILNAPLQMLTMIWSK